MLDDQSRRDLEEAATSRWNVGIAASQKRNTLLPLREKAEVERSQLGRT